MKIIQLYNSESRLIKKAVGNNRKAQNMLFELHSPKMLSVCRYYIKDIHKAEDVMLKGFFKVFSNLNKFQSRGSFEGWIRKIMIRESISFLRAQKNIEFSIEDVRVNETSSSTINVDMEVSDIQKLIDELPEGYKIVFVMYAIEGYKHQEISEMLKISVGTSKSQLFKARKMLQRKINKLNTTSHGAIEI